MNKTLNWKNSHFSNTSKLKIHTYMTFIVSRCRLQNSPYFCLFKYARAVKEKVWNEAENRERVRLLSHVLPISLLILRKKPTVLQSTRAVTFSYFFQNSVLRNFIGLKSRPLNWPMKIRVLLHKISRHLENNINEHRWKKMGKFWQVDYPRRCGRWASAKS